MGWNCGLLAIASAYLATVTKSPGIRKFLYFTLVGAICLLLLTKSRMALAATLGAMFFFWMMASSRKNKAAILLGLISLACLSYIFIGDQLLQYIDSATTLGRGQEAKETVGNLTGRLPLWEECFKWAAARPFTGYGFNTFISPRHYAAIALQVGWNPSSVHSGYMDALMGLGYIGLILLAALLLTTSFRAVMLARRFLSYSFLSSVLLWLCYNLFLEVNLITRPTFMTFISFTVLAHFAFMPEEQAATN
jgi:O-antigen ligase